MLEADSCGVHPYSRLKSREKLFKEGQTEPFYSWRLTRVAAAPCSPLERCSIQLSSLSLLTLWPVEIIGSLYSWLGWDEASCQVRGICKGVKSLKLCQLFINGRRFTQCCQNLRASVSLRASVPSCVTVRNVSSIAYFMNNFLLSFKWKISKTQDGKFSGC